MVYQATEAPNAEISICAVVESGSVRCNTTVRLVTVLSGASTGKLFKHLNF